MMQPNEKGTQKDLVLYRIETSKSDIKAAEILLTAKEFRGANNRAYYGIYHAISAVLAVYECHKKYSFSIRIVISEFLPKRSYFLPKTQTILHYLISSTSVIDSTGAWGCSHQILFVFVFEAMPSSF